MLQARFYRDVPRLLVDLANDRGGDDNVTVVVVHLANDASRPDRPFTGEDEVTGRRDAPDEDD